MPALPPDAALAAEVVDGLAQVETQLAEAMRSEEELLAEASTHLLEAGASIHEVSARLGHVDLRTTARYAAVRERSADDLADALDRGHQRAGRGW